MSKKKLNVQGIANELEGASLFFQKPVSPPPPTEDRRDPAPSSQMDEAKTERPNVPTNEPTNVPKTQRVKTRHTFDIYQDQLLALQSIQLEAVQKGKKKPKLGDMVQRAIDLYLEKNRKTQRKLG
jgi:hypothetical protein